MSLWMTHLMRIIMHPPVQILHVTCNGVDESRNTIYIYERFGINVALYITRVN